MDLELNSTTVHPNSSNNIPISPRQGRRRGSFNELPSASLESDITAPQPPWNSSPGPESESHLKIDSRVPFGANNKCNDASFRFP